MEELRVGMVLRLARAFVVAGVAGVLGGMAHVWAGGLLPSPVVLAVVAALLFAATSRFLARPASVLRLVALVGGGQFVTHVVLTATAGHAGDHSAAASAILPGSPGEAAGVDGAAAGVDGAADPDGRMAVLARLPENQGSRTGSFYDLTMATPGADGTGRFADATVPHWLIHIVEDLSGPHALMALAHLAAAAAVAFWLAMGENALWSLVCVLGVAVFAVAGALIWRPTTSASAGSLRVAGRGIQDRPRALLPPPLLGAGARRGPPAPSVA